MCVCCVNSVTSAVVCAGAHGLSQCKRQPCACFLHCSLFPPSAACRFVGSSSLSLLLRVQNLCGAAGKYTKPSTVRDALHKWRACLWPLLPENDAAIAPAEAALCVVRIEKRNHMLLHAVHDWGDVIMSFQVCMGWC